MSRISEDSRAKGGRRFKFLRNKFFITGCLFVVWVAFFDENDLVDRFQNMREIHKLKDEKSFYFKQFKEDSLRLNELETNNENLERFAREQYLMKKKNEDVFVIVKK